MGLILLLNPWMAGGLGDDTPSKTTGGRTGCSKSMKAWPHGSDLQKIEECLASSTGTTTGSIVGQI